VPPDRVEATTASSETSESCRLCGGEAKLKFAVPLSRGLTGHYRQCVRCGFLRSDHVDDPAVRDRVYATANPAEDPGAAYRQLCVILRIGELVRARLLPFGPSFRMLDFGSATGFLPASLGPRYGWDAHGFDAFARPFFDPARVATTWDAVAAIAPFDLVVASEVLEHFPDPMLQLERIAAIMRSDRAVLYATTTLHDPATSGPGWEYLARHTAQHCAFYSRPALEHVGSVLGAELVPLSEPHANEWLFVRGTAATRLHARAAARVIRRLMRNGKIPGFH
jgi:hypothetical protein